MLKNERLRLKVKENLQSALGMKEQKVHEKKKAIRELINLFRIVH